MNLFKLFLLALIWGILYSPSIASNIEIKSFKDYYEVNKDEYLDLCWEFKNADYVEIIGLGIDERKLKPKECFGFIPEENTALKFFVISGKDTLKLTSVVIVKSENEHNIQDKDETSHINASNESESEQIKTIEYKTIEEGKLTEEIKKEDSEAIEKKETYELKKIPQRGPIQFQKKRLDVSFENSEYYSGAFQATKITEPYKLKITSTNINYSNNEIEFNTIVLDEFGNFLKGLNEFENNKWTLTLQNNKFTKTIDDIEIKAFSENIPDNIGIMLDNSIAQFNREELMAYIKEFLYYQDEFDNVSFSVYNQNFYNLFDLSPMDKALWEFENLNFEQSNGLNSLYKSLFIQLDQLHKSNPVNPYLIVLAFNSDNSSLIYTADDIINLSKKFNIPIYIIGIGNAIDTYSLRYISMATGGSFYHIFDDEFQDVFKALIEISQARENHYKIKIGLNDLADSDYIISKLTLNTSKNYLTDYTKIVFEPKLNFIPYQIVANFEENSSELEDKYTEVLDALVFVLRNNPDKKIQLIGHSDREGNESDNILISKERANAVKEYLINKGINEENISIKGEGFHKPLFFNTFKDWQKRYNRRVEIKWLDPTLKPYEVVLQDLFDNEYKATNIIDKIEKSGFNSYYERYIFGDKIYYQIRLWGFASIPEAKTAAYKLQKSYRYKVYVE